MDFNYHDTDAGEDQPFTHAPDSRRENSRPESKVDPSTARRARQHEQRWSWEIFAIVVSMASLTAMVIMLTRIEGTRLDNWNFALQPNTVISALIVISKSSILSVVANCLGQLKWLYFWRPKEDRRLKDLDIFDAASRGPLGAAKFYTRMRTFVPIGVLASLITLLALLMGPFSQQMLSFVTLPVVSLGEIASIPITNVYNVSNFVSMAHSICKSPPRLFTSVVQPSFMRLMQVMCSRTR